MIVGDNPETKEKLLEDKKNALLWIMQIRALADAILELKDDDKKLKKELQKMDTKHLDALLK